MRALLALAILLTAPAHAAWLRLRAPGLEIYTDAGSAAAKRTLRRLEDLRQVFPAGGPAGPRPLRVYLFASASEFEQFSPREESAGFYQQGLEYDALLAQTGEASWNVVAHEYIHYLIHQGDARIPLWLDEGLAEFYSNVEISRGRMRAGEPIRDSLDLLKRRQFLTAAELRGRPTEEIRLYYAQAWALTHMLNLAPTWRDGMPRFIALLAQGRDETEAFQEAFGRSLEDALRALNAYVNTMRPTTVDAPVTPPAAEPNEEKLSSLDDLLLRANLAFETGRLDTARPLIEQAARKYPDRAETAAGLGALAFADGDRPQARRHLEHAVELDPTDAAAWFQLALLAQSEVTGTDRFPQLLERSLSFNPNLGEAHLLLGVRQTDNGALDQAVEHLRQAVLLMPRASHAWHALAFALQKRGDLRAAADAARRALRTAITTEQVRMAEAILELL